MIDERSIIIELFLYNNNRDSPFDFKRLLQFFTNIPSIASPASGDATSAKLFPRSAGCVHELDRTSLPLPLT